MTLKNGGKNKWKHDYCDDVGKTKDWPILSLTSIVLILFAIILIAVLKFVIVWTGKPLALVLIDSGMFTLEKAQRSLNWISENCGHLMWPSIQGISFTMFSSMLLYLDSNTPGINPPVTLSPRKESRGSYGTTYCHHIGYLTSFATGLVIFSLSVLKA